MDLKKMGNLLSFGTSRAKNQETKEQPNKNSFKPGYEIQNDTFIPKDKPTPQLHEVEGTPFKLVDTPEGWKILLGKFLITQKYFINKEKALEYIKLIPWDMVLNVIGIYIENRIEKLLSDEQNELS